ncbi:MAG: Gldg family protein, partial [Desulfatiglandales bacterium]
FLSEYEHASSGRITVEVHDPKIDSDEEEWAQKYGMRAVGLSTGGKIYFGLVLLSVDQEERIDWLDPDREELLEYDMTRIIHRLQTYKKPVVGIISTLPVFGIGRSLGVGGQPLRRNPWFFVTEMKKTYEVKEINLSAHEIDPSIDLLLIVHPRDISPKLQYAIDQYVLSGGNALIFVDPFSVSDRSQGQQGFMQPSSSSLDKLFGAWGISMTSSKAVADLDQSTRLRTGDGRVEENPTWISARKEAFSRSDVVTSRLESMLFPVAGAIEKSEGSTYEFEPMVYSGMNAALIDAHKTHFGAAEIRRDFVSAEERFNIVARVSGEFKTAFPAGPPKGEEPESQSKDKPGKVHLETGKEMATIMVVADADMLADEFYVQRSRILGFAVSKMFNDNLNFLLNACEVLTGSDDLIGLRSRGKFERPFTAVLELKRKAQAKWLAKEKELVERVERTNRKLRELEQKKDESQKLIISPEQEQEIAKFKGERRRINRELKEVRKNLRADIEALGTTLKGINIFLMPLFISIAGIAFAIYKQRRMKKR